MPCHLEMALSGLSALSVLSDLSAVRLALPSTAKLKMDTWNKQTLSELQWGISFLKFGPFRPLRCKQTFSQLYFDMLPF